MVGFPPRLRLFASPLSRCSSALLVLPSQGETVVSCAFYRLPSRVPLEKISKLDSGIGRRYARRMRIRADSSAK